MDHINGGYWNVQFGQARCQQLCNHIAHGLDALDLGDLALFDVLDSAVDLLHLVRDSPALDTDSNDCHSDEESRHQEDCPESRYWQYEHSWQANIAEEVDGCLGDGHPDGNVGAVVVHGCGCGYQHGVGLGTHLTDLVT